MRFRLAGPLLCLLAVLAMAPNHAAAGRLSTYLHTSPRAASRFWSPERMRRALPLSVHRSGSSRLVTPDAASPGHSPSVGALASSATETVADPAEPTFSQNGAVFIVGPFGALGRCSGTSVNAPNLSLVITAGHCVHEGRHWLAQKWVFVPGYKYGERPFGTFTAKWLGSTPEWISSENPNFDVGAAVVSRNERGQRLADAVGAAGIAWNLSPAQTFDVYGYPVGPPFDGATLQHCVGARFEGHAFFSFLSPGPLNLAVRCRITPGASGGGWIIAGNILNGLTADGFPGDETNYGPYFGKAVMKLFKQAARVR